ncbi:unnamed protein product [Rotaria sp. Silwood1]|nr:unnamed protein product [Rotaria sp. Silwood1]CAF3488376.1 unnamed protein product [Rotaria sp. Silwood1]CAF3551939.1 unnamed protein product [Rotaria sp. Silwood1]CAF5043388.1 unnamed protein product [Rotaria sp. Silwood1]
MAPPTKRKAHSKAVSIKRWSTENFQATTTQPPDSSTSEEEDYSSSEPIKFTEKKILSDIGDLFTLCTQEGNRKYLSTMIYMLLRHLGYSWRETDEILDTTGSTKCETAHKYADLYLNGDFEEFIGEHRGQDESTFRSGEVGARRWVIDDSAPFFSKGRGRSYMISDFLVIHPSSPYFRLSPAEWNQATQRYPKLLEEADIIYEKFSASAAINIGSDLYMDNELILEQFERLFQMLQFKEEYKMHTIEVLVDNARTHTSKEFNVDDFGMKPGTRCPVQSIEYLDPATNQQKTINCYFTDGENKGKSRGLLNIAQNLGLKVPLNCKLQQLKELVSQHPAFQNVTKLEKLGMQYGIQVLYVPKYHCELNPIEGYWCHMKQFVRKHNDQTFNKMVSLIGEARKNFEDRQIYLKLCRRFWKTLMAYNDGQYYLSSKNREH